MEIALMFILQFLGFLSASRVFLNSISRFVNIEKHTHALGEKLTVLQGSIFRVYSFPFFILFYYFDSV
jgi:hypothetical protein